MKQYTPRAACLNTALQYVTKDRNATHGDPEENFTIIADLWQKYMEQRGVEVRVEPEDVAVMMILFKIARTITGEPNADNWVDIAGYAACACEIQTRQFMYEGSDEACE